MSSLADQQKKLQMMQKANEGMDKVNQGTKKAGGASVVAGASVIAGAGTLLVASTFGLPLAGTLAVGGAIAGGAATMRSDSVGESARKVGQTANSLFSGMVAFNNKHNITGKAFKAANNSIKKAQELNDKYKVTINQKTVDRIKNYFQ